MFIRKNALGVKQCGMDDKNPTWRTLVRKYGNSLYTWLFNVHTYVSNPHMKPYSTHEEKQRAHWGRLWKENDSEHDELHFTLKASFAFFWGGAYTLSRVGCSLLKTNISLSPPPPLALLSRWFSFSRLVGHVTSFSECDFITWILTSLWLHALHRSILNKNAILRHLGVSWYPINPKTDTWATQKTLLLSITLVVYIGMVVMVYDSSQIPG